MAEAPYKIDVQIRGSHERFHDDSRGRRFRFVQEGALTKSVPPDHPWNQDHLFWSCAACGGREPVRFISNVHDSVTVPDPTEQLDAHDCDLSRVRQCMES